MEEQNPPAAEQADPTQQEEISAPTDAEAASSSDGAVADDAATEARHLAEVEALIFSGGSPMPARRIAQIAQLDGAKEVRRIVEALNARYEQLGSAFRIEEIAGGYQMLTLPAFGELLARMHNVRNETRLSAAAMETLSIVAYRQPILRADIESIRGVAAGEVLRGLMERGLVKIVGRAEVLGRPMLYGTTKRFLELFGLADLNDLPRAEEFRNYAPPGGSPAPAGPLIEAIEASPAADAAACEPAPEEPHAVESAAEESSAQEPPAEESCTQEPRDEGFYDPSAPAAPAEKGEA